MGLRVVRSRRRVIRKRNVCRALERCKLRGKPNIKYGTKVCIDISIMLLLALCRFEVEQIGGGVRIDVVEILMLRLSCLQSLRMDK